MFLVQQPTSTSSIKIEQIVQVSGDGTRNQQTTVSRTVVKTEAGNKPKSLIKRKGRRDKTRPPTLSLCNNKDAAYYSLSESPESPPLQVRKQDACNFGYSSIMTNTSSYKFSGLDLSFCGENFYQKNAEARRQEKVVSKNITEVLPGKLYVGALENLSSPNYQYFKDHNITTVVSTMSSFPEKGLELPPTVTKHEAITVRDKGCADIAKYFDEVNNIIDFTHHNGGATLIHCHSGISRSVTCCIAYLLKAGFFSSVSSAIARMAELRPISSPNLGFMGQLSQYLKSLDDNRSENDSGVDGMDDNSQ